jgi:hypothetical protein
VHLDPILDAQSFGNHPKNDLSVQHRVHWQPDVHSGYAAPPNCLRIDAWGGYIVTAEDENLPRAGSMAKDAFDKGRAAFHLQVEADFGLSGRDSAPSCPHASLMIQSRSGSPSRLGHSSPTPRHLLLLV